MTRRRTVEQRVKLAERSWKELGLVLNADLGSVTLDQIREALAAEGIVLPKK